MNPPSAHVSGRFRGDIQGLRAIAVGTVMVGHTGLGSFQGGFVGVDVFFVISGFLITQLLLVEAERDGRVSMRGFYGRRARRILPAASLVLLVTVAASLLLLNLLDALDAMKDAIWAALFAGNVRFALESVDYFAQDEAPSPIQHYWSLAVEEQFYLVWPLLILLACSWRVAVRLSLRRRLFLAIGLISVASLAWSVIETVQEPGSAYFSSLTRGWELGVGAMCALVAHRGTTGWPTWVRVLLAGSGLAAILVACLAYSESTPFPGLAAALPVLGAAAVIFAGSGRQEKPSPVARGLSWRPFRVAGDWSYSLYLWHWPLFVIGAAVLGHTLRSAEAIGLLALTLVLAGVTYRWVETPFRGSLNWGPLRSMLLYPISLVLVVGAATAGWAVIDYRASEHGNNPPVTLTDFGVRYEKKFPLDHDPAVAIVQASVIAARHHMAVPSDLTPDLLQIEDDIAEVGGCDYSGNVITLCPRGDTDGDKTLVVVGDSHGRMWIPAIDEIAARADYVVYYLVKPQCTAALVDVAQVGTHEPWPECRQFHEWVDGKMAELTPDLTIVATSPPVAGLYLDDGTLVQEPAEVARLVGVGFAELYQSLAPHTDRLVVLGDVPKLGDIPGACLSRGHPDLGDCLYFPDPVSRDIRNRSRAKAQVAGVQFIDPSRWLCYQQVCPAVIGSTVSYRDRGHLTTSYAASLAEPVGLALGIWH